MIEENNKTLTSVGREDNILTDELRRHEAHRLPLGLVMLMIILSLIAGGIGGALSVSYLQKVPRLARYFGSGSGPAGLNQNINVTENSAVIDVVKKASPAVVSIIISKDLNKVPGFGLDPFFQFFGQSSGSSSNQPNVQEVGAGSGFFVSSDGLIVTNKHVVSDTTASYTVITNDQKSYPATVVARDSSNDIAVIKIDVHNATYLNFADSDNLEIGQNVVAIGNSLGQYQNTVTSGIISGIGRSITAGSTQEGSEQLQGVIQTDAAINPGNSGGPLLNLAGQVVGINTAMDQQGQLVGFAIPSNNASKDLASYQKSGKITRPYLGVRYITLSKAIADEQKLPRDYGALILRGQSVTDFAVIPGSPADKAGLTENDIILEVNGNKVDQDHPLNFWMQKYNPGDTINLKIYHKDGEKTVSVTLGESK